MNILFQSLSLPLSSSLSFSLFSLSFSLFLVPFHRLFSSSPYLSFSFYQISLAGALSVPPSDLTFVHHVPSSSSLPPVPPPPQDNTRSDPLLRNTDAPDPATSDRPPAYPQVGGGTQFETSEFEYGRPGPETMGTSTDHTGCEQMVEQPRDMRFGKDCSFLSRPRTTHETAAGRANYR